MVTVDTKTLLTKSSMETMYFSVLTLHPDSSTYIKWADNIDFTSEDTILVGPFDFEELSECNQTRAKVAQSILWQQLYTRCLEENMLPPTTGSTISHKP